MAFCGKCGASLPEDVSFCSKCGAPLRPASGGGASQPSIAQVPPASSSAGMATPPGLVTRITNILTRPKEEWGAIASEPASVAGLYSGYIAILAAIPAIAGFIQMTMMGFGIVRVGMGTALAAEIVTYVLTLGGVYLAAFIIDKLAPNFQSQPGLIQALKLVAYAQTAVWVAGIFQLLPIIGFLGVLAGGIYSIYLFYVGLPVMMKTPPDKVVIYMIVSAVVIFVIYLVILMVAGSITAAAYLGSRIMA